MMDLVKTFFNKSRGGNTEKGRPAKIRDIRIATCALLLEMANIDGVFSPSERDQILSIMKKDFDLSEEHAKALLEASDEQLKGSIDLWQFTNLINQNYSIEEKVRIIETVWEVAYRDGHVDKHEDYLMHKLANLLRLNHRQLIDAKLKAKKSVSERDINKIEGKR